MRLRTALLATTLMAAAPAAAFATTITGPYVDLGGGYNLVQNQHATLPALVVARLPTKT